MCKDGVLLFVPIPAELSYTGEFKWAWKLVDGCIAPIVDALNKAGIYTANSCCGHDKEDGTIILHDGRILVIRKNNEYQIVLPRNCCWVLFGCITYLRCLLRFHKTV